MRVLVVKDGTVPVAVAQVIYSDGLNDADFEREDFPLEFELFEVEGFPEALVISWHEDMGFDVSGVKYLEGCLDINWQNVTEVSPGHLASTFGEGDHESYVHLFDLRYVR